VNGRRKGPDNPGFDSGPYKLFYRSKKLSDKVKYEGNMRYE